MITDLALGCKKNLLHFIGFQAEFQANFVGIDKSSQEGVTGKRKKHMIN
jgi:hypothetical protein